MARKKIQETEVKQEAITEVKAAEPVADVVVEKETVKKDSKKKVNYVDESTYNKYIGLKMLSLQGASLTDDAKKELSRLEVEVKTFGGEKAARTVNAAVKTEKLQMVAGMPMPEHYVKIIKLAGDRVVEYYLAK